MANVNLGIGSSNVDYAYDGVKANQKIHFYCSYNSSGTVTVRMNVSVTSYDFNTSSCAAYITIDGSTTNRTTGQFNVDKNSNKDVMSASKNISDGRDFTVSAKLDAYAGGWGPTPSGGKTFSFTVNVPGIYTRPGSGWTSCSQSNGTFSISFGGFSAGTNNPISQYEVWYYESSNNSSWSGRNLVTNTSSSPVSWSGGSSGYYYKFNVVAIGQNFEWSATDAAMSNSLQKQNPVSIPSDPTAIEISSALISPNLLPVYQILDTNQVLGGVNTAVKVLMCDYTNWRYIKVRPYGSSNVSTYRTQYAVWSRNKNPLVDTPDLVNWATDNGSFSTAGYDSNWILNTTTRSPGIWMRYRADASNSSGTSPGWTYSPILTMGGAITANNGGSYRQYLPWINVSGTWKPVYAVWSNVGGTWRRMG